MGFMSQATTPRRQADAKVLPSRRAARGLVPALKAIFQYRRAAVLFMALAAHTLFLWMFLASEGLERMAEAGRFTGPPGLDVKAAAYRFASERRHGMAGGWPLYMPGFFAVAIATWLGAGGRPFLRLLVEGVAVMALATCMAVALAPLGTTRVMESFGRLSGLHSEGAPLGSTHVGAGLGLLTLVTWNLFVLAGQRALAGRSLWPLWLPVAPGVLLAVSRPITVDDFVTLWAQRVAQGEGVAVFSLLAVPAATALLVWHQRREERHKRAGSAQGLRDG